MTDDNLLTADDFYLFVIVIRNNKDCFKKKKNRKRFKNGFVFIHFILVLTTQNEDNKLKMKSK